MKKLIAKYLGVPVLKFETWKLKKRKVKLEKEIKEVNEKLTEFTEVIEMSKDKSFWS